MQTPAFTFQRDGSDSGDSDHTQDLETVDPLKGFSDQVDQKPDAVAAVFEDEHLTYRALNHRANQLGHWLRKKGVGPEVVIGVCVDRSMTLVVSILGIIKAGGCLLLLEPSYPRSRVGYMVENSKPLFVLTQYAYLDMFQGSNATPISVDAINRDLGLENAQHLATPLGVGTLRVIFYTSGSTGRPKGVSEVYKKVDRSPDTDEDPKSSNGQALRVATHDRMLVKCPISFAPFLWELIEPLQVGGTVILARPGSEQDFGYVRRLIVEQSITILHFVPSSLAVFLEQADVQRCTCLARVCCSGEVLSDALREQFFDLFDVDIFLTYAATEAPGATWVRLDRENFQQPMSMDQENSRKVFILDSQKQLVSVHEQGELYVEASGRVRGYFQQTSLTAEKFVPDAFGVTPGARLYQTGDVAYQLPNGTFRVVGRTDQQVKIRGFRVELGEIEAVLNQRADIKEALVVCREDNPGLKQLVAYVIPTSDTWPGSTTLHAELQSHLPSYMVPTNFVMLEAFPLTSNGKVERQALPPPSRTNFGTTYTPPRTSLEELLIGIWQDLLKIDQIGIHDNFFELGGHSLLATQVIARLRKRLEITLPLAKFFQQPTVAALAAFVEEAEDSETSHDLTHLLDTLDTLSDEEAQALLEKELGETRKRDP